MKTTQATARISGFRFGAAAVLAGSIVIAAPASLAAEPTATRACFTPADPSEALLSPVSPASNVSSVSMFSKSRGTTLDLAPGRVATDPDLAILGANALRCAPTFAAFEQMDRVISERVAQSRDSFIAAQAARDLRVLESTLGARASFRVASAE